MFGEYIQSNQGTTRDIYGNVRSSAVDGRSPYVASNYGTVDTLQLRDGRQVRVSAVDGDSPYIVTRSNPSRGELELYAVPIGLFIGVPVAAIVGGIWGYYRGKSGK
jgi:hypothetical protein